MKIKNILLLIVFIFSAKIGYSQKEEKIKIKFNDYKVLANDVKFLETSCKKYLDEPCTFSHEGKKVFVVKTKSYLTMKKVFNQYSKTWKDEETTGYYFQINFVNSERVMYTNLTINDFLQNLYRANIFNEDGTIDEEKLNIFIIEKGEEEPRI